MSDTKTTTDKAPVLDLARYDGHTPGPWETDVHQDRSGEPSVVEIVPAGCWFDVSAKVVDIELAKDAPLLLAEVKRLRAAWESAQPAPDLETWVDELTADQGEALAQDSRWLMRLPAMAFCELLGRVANEKTRRGMFDERTDRITLHAELVKARAEAERLRAELADIRQESWDQALECSGCGWRGMERDCTPPGDDDDAAYLCPQCGTATAHRPIDEQPQAAKEIAAIRQAAREYLSASVPEAAGNGAVSIGGMSARGVEARAKLAKLANWPPTHRETIRCPQCGTVQAATVVELQPWDELVHTCGKCGHVIMESEWERVDEALEQLAKEA